MDTIKSTKIVMIGKQPTLKYGADSVKYTFKIGVVDILNSHEPLVYSVDDVTIRVRLMFLLPGSDAGESTNMYFDKHIKPNLDEYISIEQLLLIDRDSVVSCTDQRRFHMNDAGDYTMVRPLTGWERFLNFFSSDKRQFVPIEKIRQVKM